MPAVSGGKCACQNKKHIIDAYVQTDALRPCQQPALARLIPHGIGSWHVRLGCAGHQIEVRSALISVGRSFFLERGPCLFITDARWVFGCFGLQPAKERPLAATCQPQERLPAAARVCVWCPWSSFDHPLGKRHTRATCTRTASLGCHQGALHSRGELASHTGAAEGDSYPG